MSKEKIKKFWENDEFFIKHIKYLTNIIVQVRNDADLTQSTLAEITGLKQQQISKFENGLSNWSLKTFFKVLKALNLTLKLERISDGQENPALNETGFYSID